MCRTHEAHENDRQTDSVDDGGGGGLRRLGALVLALQGCCLDSQQRWAGAISRTARPVSLSLAQTTPMSLIASCFVEDAGLRCAIINITINRLLR